MIPFPSTSYETVPVFVPQTTAIQTFYSTCPDTPPTTNLDTTTPTTITTTSSSLSTIIQTQYSTYTNSGGTYVSSTVVSSPASPTNNGDGSTNNPTPLAPIIGGVVGGLVGLLAIIALVWFILWRREQVKHLFDDDDDYHPGAGVVAAGRLKGNRPTALLARGGRGGERNVNLDEEIKEARPYQYGVVGGTQSSGVGGGYYSQNSTVGYGGAHQRNNSRDALMAAHSPPISPRHLEVPLPAGGGYTQATGASRRASQYTGSSSMSDPFMMTSQPPIGVAPMAYNNVGNNGGRVSDERDAAWMGHNPRPPSPLEAPASYPPGHGGFYQQYGPVDQPPPTQQSPPPPPPPPSSAMYPPPAQTTVYPPPAQTSFGASGIHKPPLEPGLATRPIPAHQALFVAAGLGSAEPHSTLAPSPSVTSRTQVLASPPPGAGGARQYFVPSNPPGVAGSSRPTDLFSATTPAGDAVVASSSTTAVNEVGFGRQRASGEKSREREPGAESARSPVIQHQDAGRIPDASGSGPNTVDGHLVDAPPAYTDP